MQEGGGRDLRPRPGLLQRLRPSSTPSSPNSTASSACSTRSGSPSSSSSATAPSPSARCAAAKASWPSLIRNSNAVFQTTAARDRDIEALFRAFPTFQDESRLTFNRLKEFALNADPLIRQLVPAAEQLSPTLIAFSQLAPQAKGFFEGLSTVIERAPTGFPALRKFFRDDFPRAAEGGRSLPAQSQPDPQRLWPLQARDHLCDGQRRGGHEREYTTNAQGRRFAT